MGLDMYAYTIDARLIDEDQVTDAPIYKAARRAVGFLDLYDHDLKKLTEEGVTAYYQKREAANHKAQEEGWINPEFAYWRKFNHLHGWMESLYRSKGGTDPNFNCNNVRLDLQDLDRLESMASLKALAPTQGFFFGADEPFDNDDKQNVLEFVTKAREAIADGKAVFYDSWW
jgi:hypothetical protein